MPTSAVSSFGTLLKIGNGGTPTETFTTIAEVRDISGPAFSVGTEDVTNHDSSGWREFIPTIIEAGEVTFDVNFKGDATQGFASGSLYDDMIDKTKRNFQIVLPSGVGSANDTGAFAAYVTGFELSAPVEGVLSASITLMITGAVTWS
jgi:predicted secreted protein